MIKVKINNNSSREQSIGSRRGGEGGLDKADHQDNSPHCGAMKILHNSAQSLIKKINELNILAFDIQPVIICVSETLTNAEHTGAYLGINNYDIICRKDRQETKRGIGGGLLAYAKSNLGACEFEGEYMNNFNQCCEIKFRYSSHSYIHLILIYRPHNLYNGGDVAENNQVLIKAIKNLPSPFTLMGDFNYSDINWNTRSATFRMSKDFLDLVEEKF